MQHERSNLENLLIGLAIVVGGLVILVIVGFVISVIFQPIHGGGTAVPVGPNIKIYSATIISKVLCIF